MRTLAITLALSIPIMGCGESVSDKYERALDLAADESRSILQKQKELQSKYEGRGETVHQLVMRLKKNGFECRLQWDANVKLAWERTEAAEVRQPVVECDQAIPSISGCVSVRAAVDVEAVGYVNLETFRLRMDQIKVASVAYYCLQRSRPELPEQIRHGVERGYVIVL